ncbi:MAG: glycosyltransferase [Paludibacteraceae bacterium]|nr:glycosyltransferase [Paludibacteraceae bacterium]
MSKKWILYLGGFDMPDGNAAAQRVMGNAKAFRKLGYDTFFVGLSRKKDLCGEIGYYEGFKYINHYYPENTKEWISYLSSVEQYKEYLDKQPNIIIAYNFPAFALNKLCKWSNRKNIKIIADCTEWYEAKGNIAFRLIKGFDTWYRMKRIHPKMDGLIAISDYLYNYYSQKMQNVANIPPLVDLDMEKWKLNNDDNRLNDDAVKIIYAGSPGNGNKDRLDFIINALSLLKNEKVSNFRFIVIGITEDQYLSQFNMPIPENLKDNLVFKGRLSHLDTVNAVKQSDFYLFIRNNNLSNRAGFPTKFSESISCGTPVVANSSSNIRQFIVNGKNGFIIDHVTLNELKNILKDIIQLPKTQIYEMKNFCYQSQLFDYRNYLLKFDKLVNMLS